jgi:hypothetical protein
MWTVDSYVAQMNHREVEVLQFCLDAEGYAFPENLSDEDLELVPRLIHFGLLRTIFRSASDLEYMGEEAGLECWVDVEITDLGRQAVQAFERRSSQS